MTAGVAPPATRRESILDSPLHLARRLVRLAVPVAVARLGIMSMGVVDTVVVGQLVPGELAHQALGWTIPGPFLLGGIGLLTGVQVLAARAIGEGRPEAAGAAWRRGLALAAAAGLVACALVWASGRQLLVALGVAPGLAEPSAAVARVLALSIPLHLAFIASTYFLEALQRPAPGAVAMWAANAINLALNLAFVPSWGAIGSAWATVLSRLFLAGTVAGYIVSARGLKTYRASVVVPRLAGYRALLVIGAAAALSHLFEAGAFAGMTVIAGRLGETAVATFQIATNLLSVVFMIALGLSTAGAVLVSEAVGRGARREAARVGWTAIGLNALAMAACGAGCFCFAGGLARAYTADAGLIETVTAVMGLTALLMTPDGGQGVADSVLRARGDNWFPTASRMLAYVIVMPALALLLGEGGGRGVDGVLEAVVAASFLAYGALLARFALLTRPGAFLAVNASAKALRCITPS